MFWSNSKESLRKEDELSVSEAAGFFFGRPTGRRGGARVGFTSSSFSFFRFLRGFAAFGALDWEATELLKS